MPFGLTIGTERATALQNAIQAELINRRYSSDPDPVMAEYITIMIINNKSSEQISSELEDLIGSDFERSFTDWLFAEAAKGEQPEPSAAPAPVESQPAPTRDPPPHVDAARRPPSGPRNGPLYQQAISQATSNTSPTAQKRTASARSPSPGGQGPSKTRRTDVPSGPRAMREGRHGGPPHRSLLDRVGPARAPHPNGFPMEEQMMMGGPFPPNMNEMDMNAMAAAMQQQMGAPNPIMLQEMMMNQMALMAQMASSLGMLNPGMMGMPMQGGMPDMGMFNQGGPVGPQGHQGPGPIGRGRGGPPMRGRGGGRPPQGQPRPVEERQASVPGLAPQEQLATSTPTAPQIATSTSQSVASQPAPAPATPAFSVPERPGSPTLCKFGLKCTNMHCRWSHPSPVATPESGVVLSNDPCDKGKNCKDKDCIKAHVSPAVANPSIAVDHTKSQPHPAPASTALQAYPQAHSPSAVQCRYGVGCTRRDCTFQHPPGHPFSKAANAASQPCRFGASCTRASCPYQHPEGRVLPGSFHRGVSTTAPLVNVPSPATGSIGAPSPHRSVVFNSTSSKADIERKLKELQEEKSRAEEKMKAAEAAVAGKKDATGEPPVALVA